MNDDFSTLDEPSKPITFDRCIQRVVHEFCFHRSPEVIERIRGTIECFASRLRGCMSIDANMRPCNYDSIVNLPLSNTQIAMLLAEVTPRAMEFDARSPEWQRFVDAESSPIGSGLPEIPDASNEDVIRSFIRDCRCPEFHISTLSHIVSLGFGIRKRIDGLSDIISSYDPSLEDMDFSSACDMLQPPLLQSRQEAIVIGLGLALPSPVVTK